MHHHYLAHFNKRPAGSYIDTVIVHSMCAINSKDPLDPTACIKVLDENKVSAHYLIDRLGAVYQLVSESDRAWHAGVSQLPFKYDPRHNLNDFSIGIELIAVLTEGFLDAQYQALIEVINNISKRHSLRYILGHEHVAPTRKEDPGPKFDWQRLRKHIISPNKLKVGIDI